MELVALYNVNAVEFPPPPRVKAPRGWYRFGIFIAWDGDAFFL